MWKIKTLFLDLIYPKFCFGCSQEDIWLCDSCERKIVYVKTQVCPKCLKVSIDGKYCLKCRYDVISVKVKGKKKPKKLKIRKPLEGVISSCYYEEGPIKELVHNFKYNHITEVGEFLSDMMARAFLANYDIKSNFTISATPMFWYRQQIRGYNQAEVLARAIAEKFKKPYQQMLKKRYRKKNQVQLQGDKRRENLKNAFYIKPGVDVAGKTIVLVDDITTTGATLLECAKVLQENGAKEVWGLVVARG